MLESFDPQQAQDIAIGLFSSRQKANRTRIRRTGQIYADFKSKKYLLKKAREVTVTFSLAGLDFTQMHVTVTFDLKILRRYSKNLKNPRNLRSVFSAEQPLSLRGKLAVKNNRLCRNLKKSAWNSWYF